MENKKNNIRNVLEKRNKKYRRKIKLRMILILLIGISIIFLVLILSKKEEKEQNIETSSNVEEENQVLEAVISKKEERKIDDWRLVLVNSKNPLPENFNPELVYIDKTRQVDKRIANELSKMIQAMRNSGINNIWVQSAYRSIEYQKDLYNNKINEYLQYGISIEEAERLTSEYINKPGESEHNLGLAVDFNNVNDDFKNSKAFKWLGENAKDYGFIMRYPEEKKEITGVEYETWHWRYVGKEHAYKMEELKMCLEEYIEYLKKN